MNLISVKFQAYIPKSLGRPITSYFLNSSRLRRMHNRAEFVRRLRALDNHGYRWLPEPGTGIFGYYTSTDTVDINDHHDYHSTRLETSIVIDPRKLGRYNPSDSFLRHRTHPGSRSRNHHSSDSHRVRVTVSQDQFYWPMEPRNDVTYTGRVGNLQSLRSVEEQHDIEVKNKYADHHPPDRRPQVFQTTEFTIGASAGYPFLPAATTPNIDYSLKITASLTGAGRVILKIEGTHNRFPAYELIVNDRLEYHYNPASHGQLGPGPINLNSSERFSQTMNVWHHAQAPLVPRY